MEIVQQKMEEAQNEVAAADQAVSEARQTAVQDTSLLDAEVLVEALKIPSQPHGLDWRTKDALTRMCAEQYEGSTTTAATTISTKNPGQSLTPTVTQRHGAVQRVSVTQEADITQAIRQAESSASGQDQYTNHRKSNGRGPEEQIHPVSQREGCSLWTKKKQSHDENRQAEVQGGNARIARMGYANKEFFCAKSVQATAR